MIAATGIFPVIRGGSCSSRGALRAACFLHLFSIMAVPALVSPASAAEGVRLGPVLLYPMLQANVTYDSNTYLTPDNEEDEFITAVTPSLRAVLPVRRIELELEGTASFVEYSEGTQENNQVYGVAGAVGGRFPGGLEFTFQDQLQHGYFKQLAEFDVAEYYDINRLYLQAAFQFRNRLKIELQYYNYIFRYDKSDDLDRVEHTVAGIIHLRLTPTLSALVEGSYADLAYSADPFTVKDNQGLQVRGGVTWKVTGKTTGELRVGYHEKTYEAGVTEDTGNLVAVLTTDTDLTSSTRMKISIQRQTVESDYTANPYYLTTRIGAELIHKFNRRLTGTAGVWWRRDEYPNETAEEGQSAERLDNLIGGKIGLQLQLLRVLFVSLSYSLEERGSNLDVFDYTDQQLELSARVAF